MAFTWKDKKDIWKGEGIYFLTFVVAGRQKLLGELVDIPQTPGRKDTRNYSVDVPRPQITNGLMPNFTSEHQTAEDATLDSSSLPYPGWCRDLCTSELATVRLSPLGMVILHDLLKMPYRYAKPGTPADEVPLKICAKQFMPNHLHVVIWVKKDLEKSIRQIAQGFRIGVRQISERMGVWKRKDGHTFEVPFIRTLAHKGQLRAMIDYVHANPDNAWRLRNRPDLYVIRRNQQHGGLHFDTMGKARLLDYPDRNVVALSRSLTPEQIEAEVQKALRLAESGAVTYCAAMNAGEKAVTKAIRAAGYPLVVMMLDGFPPEGTDAARFFHPGGAYHQACGEGRLYLMAPLAENYNAPRLIALTEKELVRKAEEKHQMYTPLPHTSTRWRMIAGNMMLGMIGET